MHRLGRAGIAVVLLVGVLWAGGVAIARPGKSVVVCENSFSHTVRIYGSGCIYGREVKHVWPTGDEVPALCYSPVSRFVKLSPVNGCDAGLKVLKASSGSRALVCADTKSGVLRWPRTGVCWWEHTSIMLRLKSTSSNAALAVAETPATTTTSTTSATSTTAVVVPSVSLTATWIQSITFPKAVTVTTNVAGTIYFAEGAFVVKTVADITSAPSYRWAQGTVTSANTPTSIAIDVDAVTNGYYRVFVANSQGVLSAPATNIVTISIPRTPTAAEIAAATTIALTCAQGGSCTVGVDTGPGGGVVFYYSATAFTSTGSDCTNCHYLEAAPANQLSDIVWATTATNCYASGSTLGTSNCASNSIYSGNSQSASRTAATDIGMGMANTNQIHNRLTTVGLAATNTYAAGIAWDYENNSKTDWFLPSKDELNELCKYARTQTTGATGTQCASTGPLRTGFSPGSSGVSTFNYWSSSEYAYYNAWYQYFNAGGRSSNSKVNLAGVRPVRAF